MKDYKISSIHKFTEIGRGVCLAFGGGRKYAYGKIVGYNPATKTLTVAANPE